MILASFVDKTACLYLVRPIQFSVTRTFLLRSFGDIVGSVGVVNMKFFIYKICLPVCQDTIDGLNVTLILCKFSFDISKVQTL